MTDRLAAASQHQIQNQNQNVGSSTDAAGAETAADLSGYILPLLLNVSYTTLVMVFQTVLLLADFGLFVLIEVLSPIYKLSNFIFHKTVVSPFTMVLKFSLHIHRKLLIPFWYFAVIASVVGMIAGLVVGLCAIIIQTVIPVENSKRPKHLEDYSTVQSDNAESNSRRSSRDISPLSSPVTRRSSFSNYSAAAGRHANLRGARSMSNLGSSSGCGGSLKDRSNLRSNFLDEFAASASMSAGISSTHRRRESTGSNHLLISDEDMFYEDEDGYSGMVSRKSSISGGTGGYDESISPVSRRSSKTISSQPISTRPSLTDISSAIPEDDEASMSSGKTLDTSTIPRSYGSVSFSTDVGSNNGPFYAGMRASASSSKHSFIGSDVIERDSRSTSTDDLSAGELTRRVIING